MARPCWILLRSLLLAPLSSVLVRISLITVLVTIVVVGMVYVLECRPTVAVVLLAVILMA